MFFHIIGTRMALDGKVSSAESIEEIETYRELRSKPCIAIAKDGLSFLIHQQIDRYLKHLAGTFKEQAIFRDYQLERPCIIGELFFQSFNMVPYPCSAPGSRFKPWSCPENIVAQNRQGGPQELSSHPERVKWPW